MRLVDTSAWIEFLTGSALGVTVQSELPDPAQWLVPTMVQLELAKWLAREVGEDKADQVIAFTETCVVADLDTATALSAAELCARHKLATADAIVYATALAYGADLLTCISKTCPVCASSPNRVDENTNLGTDRPRDLCRDGKGLFGDPAISAEASPRRGPRITAPCFRHQTACLQGFEAWHLDHLFLGFAQG